MRKTTAEISHQKVFSRCDDLPEGWVESPLKKLIIHVLGGEWGKDDTEKLPFEMDRVNIIRGTDFKNFNDKNELKTPTRIIKKASLEKRQLKSGDIIVEISGGAPDQPVGRTLLIDKKVLEKAKNPLICSNFCRQMRIHPDQDPKFVNFCLHYQYHNGNFDHFQTQSTNIRNLNFNDFSEEIIIPLPPLSEQQHIVARIETLLAHVNAARDRLSRVPVIMKKFRQGVLAAACCGRLTEDLYDMHYPIFSQNDQFKASNKHLSLDNKDNLESSEYYELPSQWSWIEFSQLLKKSPQNGLYKKFILNPNGVRLLDIKGLYRGIYANFEGSRKISLSSEEINVYSLNNDDLLINRVSKKPEGVGKAVLVKDIDEPSVFESNMIRVNLNFNRVISPYILYYLQSEFARDKILKSAKMTNQASINQQDIKNIPVPLPPLAEQHEIVRRVETLFERADAIEREVVTASRRCEALTQAVLGKAFSGRL